MLKLSLNRIPIIETRPILSTDTKEIVRNKQKKPFMNKHACILSVFTDNLQFTITAPSNYCFDGATIPFGIGKGDMRLLIPALFHDVMCEKKYLVNNDRKLSTEIFKELLLMMKVSKFKANFMYKAVYSYQKLMKGWEN